MGNEPIIVAIELGTSRISGIAGKKKDGNLTILAYAEEQTTACIKRGLVYNVEKTTQSIRNVLDKLSSTLNQEIKRVYVGIGGQSVRSVKKKVPRNMLTQTSITAAHIDELKKQGMDIAIPDCELLANIVQGYIVDSNPTNEPQGVFGTNIEGEFLNIIARTQLRGNIQTCFNNVGVEIAGTLLSALELSKNILKEQEMRAGCAMIDLGAGTTTVVVYKQNVVRYLVTLPIGFNNIVDDLKTLLQIEEKEACEVLMKYGNAYIDADDDTADLHNSVYTTSTGVKKKLIVIHEMIEARLTEIIANAVEQIHNSGYAASLLAGIIITGGGANMKNIDKAFKENPRKRKFDVIRVAKSLVIQPIKHTAASLLNLDNAMSGSLVSLLMAGTENCVGDEGYSGDDIFKRSQTNQMVRENTEKTAAEAKKLTEMLDRLEQYKDQMREHINKMTTLNNLVKSNPKDKTTINNGIAELSQSERICNENYENLMNSLSIYLKNDQRLTETRNLEKQLEVKMELLRETVNEAKKSTSLIGRFRQALEKMVNGDD